MKNKVLSFILGILLLGQNAYAASCADQLVAAHFSPGQAVALCTVLGTSIGASLIPDTTNAYDLGSASLNWKTLYLSNNAVFTTTATGVLSNTSDAADSKNVFITGGGAINTSGTRGAWIQLNGNEEGTNPGDLIGGAGNVSGGEINLSVPVASGNFYINTSNLNLRDEAGNAQWVLDTNGVWTSNATTGGAITMQKPAADLNLSGTGSTIAIQEATAGSACSGTLTANGATPVVTSTSCATTGSRVFLSRTSAETGTVSAWKSALSNGVSFSITSEAADTGTYDWLIVHEAP